MINVFSKNKVVISLSLVFSFLILFVSSVFSPVFASAASSELYPDKFETGYFNSSSNIVTALNSAFDALDVNQSIFLDDYYVFISNYSLYGFGSVFLLDKNNTSVSNNGYADTYFCSRYYSFFISYSGIQFRSTVSSNVIDFSSISSIDFNSLNYNSSYKVSVGCPFSWQNAYGLIYDGTDTVSDSWYLNRNYNALVYDYCLSFTPVFNSTFEQVQLPFFSLDVDDFYTWLVNNDKISVSGGSGGISFDGKIPSYIGVQKLKSFLQFYKSYGSSNESFVKNIVKWFSYMNIVSQSKDNINILKNTIDSLYNEYINYRSGTHAYWPGATKIQERNDIDTQTNNNNLTLVTDDSTDTLDISILRDILRGVIAISNNLIQGVSDIVSALNRLDFTVNVANDGGTGFSASDIWGTGDITHSENYLALTNAFMDKGVDVSAAENLKINYLENATQQDSFTVSVVMPDQFVNGSFTEKTVTHTIDNTSKMYNTLILFRKLIAFAVIAYFAIRIRFELPHLIRGE